MTLPQKTTSASKCWILAATVTKLNTVASARLAASVLTASVLLGPILLPPLLPLPLPQLLQQQQLLPAWLPVPPVSASVLAHSELAVPALLLAMFLMQLLADTIVQLKHHTFS